MKLKWGHKMSLVSSWSGLSALSFQHSTLACAPCWHWLQLLPLLTTLAAAAAAIFIMVHYVGGCGCCYCPLHWCWRPQLSSSVFSMLALATAAVVTPFWPWNGGKQEGRRACSNSCGVWLRGREGLGIKTGVNEGDWHRNGGDSPPPVVNQKWK